MTIGKLASGTASVTRFSAENAVSVGNAASLDASISKHDQLAVGASLGPKVEPRRSRAQRGIERQGDSNTPEASADG